MSRLVAGKNNRLPTLTMSARSGRRRSRAATTAPISRRFGVSVAGSSSTAPTAPRAAKNFWREGSDAAAAATGS